MPTTDFISTLKIINQREHTCMHTSIRTHQNTVLDLDNINRVDFHFSEKQLLWMMLFLLGIKG
jgi:hypothetical protein